jgi:hypothetical protein
MPSGHHSVLLAVLGALLAIPAALRAQDDDGAYRLHMDQCEQAKQKGDYPAMAAAIRTALKHRSGSEYAWRSLAWALHHAGQWQNSLGVARVNVDRNGAGGWSLEQLAESEMGAGDWAGARMTLARIEALPPEAIGSAQEAIAGTRKRLLDLTGQRRYELHWQVDLGQGGPDKPPERLLMPRWGDPRQTFEFTVSNAVSFKPVSEGPRDFIDVVQKPGEPFDIRATVTIRGVALGPIVLEGLTSWDVPEEVRGCLGPFQHGGELFDPASPVVARIAGLCRSTTPARTVQNLLDWMRDNMTYADTQNRTPDTILAGGQGVCHHQCSSFAALCRAAGIPARVAHGVVLEGEGEFRDNQGSHGWTSVYLAPLGWVPLDPLDARSLVLFGRSNYLLTDYANETATDNHFAHRSIQGFKCDGKVLALEAQPQ